MWGVLKMLSTNYRNQLVDICCRLISTDSVTLKERIWMNKLCEKNLHARELVNALMCPDQLEDQV